VALLRKMTCNLSILWVFTTLYQLFVCVFESMCVCLTPCVYVLHVYAMLKYILWQVLKRLNISKTCMRVGSVICACRICHVCTYELYIFCLIVRVCVFLTSISTSKSVTFVRLSCVCVCLIVRVYVLHVCVY